MTAKTYSCPKCGIPLRSSPKGPLGGVREVSAKDINVAKDFMLCPSCGEVSSFSEVVGVAREAEREDGARRLLEAFRFVCHYNDGEWMPTRVNVELNERS